MFEKVKKILSSHVAVDSSLITPEAALVADLGLSSFDVVNVVVEFEDEFNIEIADRDIRSLTTVNDILAYIQARV